MNTMNHKGYIARVEFDEREAQKPYSGKFALRMPPELHAQAAAKAAAVGKSINQWLVDTVQTALHV